MMSLLRFLGYTSLACGCVTGHYREVATSRDVTYVEEKGTGCVHQSHRRNHTLAAAAPQAHTTSPVAKTSAAS